MFSGGGGQSSNTLYGSNSISGPVPGSPYEVFQNQQLANIGDLSMRPYQPYDVGAMFAPINNQQQAAYTQINNALAGPYNSLFNSAGEALNNNSAAGTFNQAASTPTALGTANPYLQFSSQTAPQILDQYMNPYIDKSVNAANKLASENFLQNTLPGLTDQFVSSGGGLGGKNYGRDMNWALTNFSDSTNRNTQNALASGFFNSMNAAQADLARQGALAGTAGNLALGDLQGRTNLGIAQGNNALNTSGAYSNLANSYVNNQLNAGNAMLNAGNQQQAWAQAPLTASYEQFREGQQWPYQTAGWAANTANQYSWPMRQNTQGWQSTTSQSSQSGSPLGSILGGLATVGSLAIPGASGVSAIGNIMGGIGNFGRAAGSGTQFKRGGSVTRFSAVPGLQIPGEARTIAPVNTFGEPLSRGFFNYSPRTQIAPKTQSAFANTYAKGGKVSPIQAVHKHERDMHGAKKSELTKFKRGGYLGLNAPSKTPKVQPAFKDTYATGGAVAVIKVAKANTKRSNKASAKRKQLAAKMARRGTPVDLEPRSGFFQ